jgi:hypothetical protein
MRRKGDRNSYVLGVGADYFPNLKFKTIPKIYYRSYLLRGVDE